MTALLDTRYPPTSADSERRPKRRRPVALRQASFFVALLIVAVVWLFPFAIVVLNSLHTGGNLSTNIVEWFDGLTLANFPRAWNSANLGVFVLNSALVAVIKVPLGLLISAMCAFALSRFRYRFRGGAIAVVIGASAIPMQIPLITLFGMLLDLGMLDTYQGLILAYLAFGIPFQTVFLVAHFSHVPIEIEEAARIDGCGPWRYFATVILPLARPMLAALFVLDFVGTWNEFPIALTLLQTKELWTVPLGLLSFLGPYTNDYQLLSAAMIIAAIPVLIVYFSMQRFFVSGLTAGAVKG